mgnify:CR=1 FL=1
MDRLWQSYVGAKELTVYPGQTVTIKDSGAYGCILTQGFGTIGGYQCETAGMLRFGQLSADEFFVGEKAATAGVKMHQQLHLRAFGYLEALWPESS